MPNGLTEGFAESLIDVDGIEAITEIRTATLHIKSSHKADGTVVDQPRPGYVIPVHAAIVAPEGLEYIVGISDLAADELVLGEDSAALRRLEVGDTITFERSTMTVGAIVPAALMSGYEMIATTPEPFVEERMETRAVHVLYGWSRYRLSLEVRARVDEDITYRVSERSTSADRGGLAVRSQTFIKQVFGEFAYNQRQHRRSAHPAPRPDAVPPDIRRHPHRHHAGPHQQWLGRRHRSQRLRRMLERSLHSRQLPALSPFVRSGRRHQHLQHAG
jgi:hypothetical protein